MRVAYLPANQAWVILWGDSIIPDEYGQRLFATRREAEEALRRLRG